MRVEIADGMDRRAEAAPIAIVFAENSETLVHSIPRFRNVAGVKVVARVVSEDVGVKPQALAFDGAQGTDGDSRFQGLVVNAVMHRRCEAGIEVSPEFPTLAIIRKIQITINIPGVNQPKMIGIKHVMRHVFETLDL